MPAGRLCPTPSICTGQMLCVLHTLPFLVKLSGNHFLDTMITAASILLATRTSCYLPLSSTCFGYPMTSNVRYTYVWHMNAWPEISMMSKRMCESRLSDIPFSSDLVRFMECERLSSNFHDEQTNVREPSNFHDEQTNVREPTF